MVHFRDPAGAVLAALEMVEHFPAAGLPPVHVGVAAGPGVTFVELGLAQLKGIAHPVRLLEARRS
jgi:hypothetical protein